MILLCYWEMSFYAFGCHGIVNITVAMSLWKSVDGLTSTSVPHERRCDGFLCRSTNCSTLPNMEWFQVAPALPQSSTSQRKTCYVVWFSKKRQKRRAGLIRKCWSPALLSLTSEYLIIYSASVSKPPKSFFFLKVQEKRCCVPRECCRSRMLLNWELGYLYCKEVLRTLTLSRFSVYSTFFLFVFFLIEMWLQPCRLAWWSVVWTFAALIKVTMLEQCSLPDWFVNSRAHLWPRISFVMIRHLTATELYTSAGISATADDGFLFVRHWKVLQKAAATKSLHPFHKPTPTFVVYSWNVFAVTCISCG